MKPLSLQQIAEMTGGRLVQGDPSAVVDAVLTDTRNIKAGSLFVALAGENFDAHDFVPRAFENGARAVMVRRIPASPVSDPQSGVILVADTLTALQRLAARYRDTLSPFVCVGVTGSNGKTSTKDLLASVLGRRHRVNATIGNLNNHIGLPLTVLRTGADHTAGVWELGMNHPGEIAPLAAIAKPDLAVITNIGTAHIEFMGSREAIALEKGMLAEAVPVNGCVVMNADDDMTPVIANRCRARILTAGIGSGDIRAENIDGTSFDVVVRDTARIATPPSAIRVSLPVPGRHMIANAILAAATGLFLGLTLADVKAGLEGAALAGGRLERRTAAGLAFLDDSYNANPDSMRAAFATLAALPCAGRRIAVLGHMAELGAHSAAGHRDVGHAAEKSGVDFLVTVGGDDSQTMRDAFGNDGRSRHFLTLREAAQFVRDFATPSDLILVKGSRSAAMERIITEVAAS